MDLQEIAEGVESNFLVKFENGLEEKLKDYSSSPFYKMLSYSLRGGKRIRPLLLYLVYKALGERRDPFNAAISVELMHALSLIHDDVIDREVARRGEEPFYVKFGQENALLITDYVFGIVIDLVNSYNDPEVLNVLSETSIKMSEGEELELLAIRSGGTITIPQYISIIEKKTASLFEASAGLAALLSARPELYIKMSELGRAVGILYQVKDDLKDRGNENEIINVVEGLTGPELNGIIEKYSFIARESLEGLEEGPAKDSLKKVVSLLTL